MKSVIQKVLCVTIDKYYFRNPKGRIYKYSQFCRRKNCKIESSYNYENLKPRYCFKHKKEDMVNVKRGHKLCKVCKSSHKTKCTSPKCKYTIKDYKTQSAYMKLKTIEYLKETKQEYFLCRICHEIVSKDHFNSDEHIKTFNSVVSIDVKKSIKNCFISIKTQFYNTNYNAIYTDFYFKKKMKDLVLENTDVNKFYKSYILKKNMISFNYRDDQVFYSDKYDSDNIINDIDKIENLEKNEEYLKPQLIKSSMTNDYDYNIDQMYIDLDAINFKQSKHSIKYFHHMGCDIKLMKCTLLRGGQYNYEEIPKTFLDSKVISIIKNQDDKCFLYCYIRKHLNLVKGHSERVSRVDKRLAKKLEEELNYNFDNVEIKQLSKIEDLLETNVYVYSCVKNFKNKIPLFRSNKNYDKFLDLLLYEKHYMNINKLNIFFNPNSTNKTWFCRSCNNSFYSKVKYDDHVLYCKTAKPLILMPSKNKYIKFKNIQNTIQLPFVAYCDIESELLKQNNLYNHEHHMSGYKLDCVDKQYSKPIQIFDTLEKFRDGLINELDYIDKINHEIDMTTFNQKEFDDIDKCKYCHYDFTKKYNGRKIILLEKVDK